MKTPLFTIIFSLFMSLAFGQSEINGNIHDVNGKNIAFANVILKNTQDSTKIVKGTITDLKGNYVFSDVPDGQYIVWVSSMGYQSRFDTIVVKGKNVLENISLHSSVSNLKEVVIKSSSVKNGINKVTFYTTSRDKKNAKNSIDLLEKIPKLMVDNVNNKITTVKGTSVKILINGMNASEADLLAINPNQVIKIEYYDIPPVRYSNLGFDAVINVITKKSQQGISGVVNFQNAVTTGFGNDLLGIKYNRKNAQWSLNYYLNFRDYSKRTVDEIMQYSLGNLKYQKIKTGLNSPMNSKINMIDLAYSVQKDSNFSFRVKLSPYFTISNRKVTQNLNYSYSSGTKISGISNITNTSDNFRPVLDIYFSKEFKKNQELIFDIVSTYFYSKYQNIKKEVSSANDTIMYYNNLTDNSKTSIIGEGLYIKRYHRLKLSTGYRFSIDNSKQKVSNSFGTGNYYIKTSEQYVYSEIVGNLKKFSYDLSIGLSRNSYIEKENNSQFNFISLRPLVDIGYSISKKSTIKLKYNHEPVIPAISQLSSNKFLIDEKIIYTGNPNLKPFSSNNFNIEYTVHLPRLFISSEFDYSSAKNPIISSFIRKGNFIYNIYGNQKSKNSYSFDASVNYTPFKSGLVSLTLFTEYYGQENEITNSNKYRIKGLYFSGTIKLNHKDFHLTYQYASNYNYLSNQYVFTTAPYSYIEAIYKKRTFTVGCGFYYPFSASWLSSGNTFNNSIVQDKQVINIYDNGKMFILNFSYNFSSGRKYKEKQKIIQNRDNDSGVLKVKN